MLSKQQPEVNLKSGVSVHLQVASRPEFVVELSKSGNKTLAIQCTYNQDEVSPPAEEGTEELYREQRPSSLIYLSGERSRPDGHYEKLVHLHFACKHLE